MPGRGQPQDLLGKGFYGAQPVVDNGMRNRGPVVEAHTRGERAEVRELSLVARRSPGGQPVPQGGGVRADPDKADKAAAETGDPVRPAAGVVYLLGERSG